MVGEPTSLLWRNTRTIKMLLLYVPLVLCSGRIGTLLRTRRLPRPGLTHKQRDQRIDPHRTQTVP